MRQIPWRRNQHVRAAMIRFLAVLVLVDLAALILIGAAILLTWAGLQWLIGW